MSAHPGSRHPFSKLTEAQVHRMKQRALGGIGPSQLAREFGVSRQTTSGILLGQRWKHVTLEETEQK